MKKNILNKLLYVIPAIIICGLAFYIYKYNVVFLDSDASSELVLANLLNKTGQIMSPDWYYSTELKFINTNLVFAPLFSTFNNWAVVRAVGTGICLLFMVLSALYLYKQLEIRNKAILLCLLLLPISVQYFGMYIGQPSYEFSSIKTFLTIGLLLSLLKKENKLKIVLLFLLSFIQGSEGFRNIVITIIPIILVYVILEICKYYNKLDISKEETLKKLRKIIIVIIIGCLLGVILYIFYFSKVYSFSKFQDMSFTFLDDKFISSLFNNWLQAFGYVENKVMSLSLLHNAIALIMFVLTIYVTVDNIRNLRNNTESAFVYTSIFSLSFVIMIGLTIFVHFINSDMDRYYLPIIVLSFPLIFEWLQRKGKQYKIYNIAFIVLISCICFCGLDNLNIYRNNNNRTMLSRINTGRPLTNTVELNDIVYKLNQEGYKYGYSYFWNGNIITELSNGQIEMWVWNNGNNDTKELKDIDETYKWLQLKDHEYRKPNKKLFLIFNKTELDYSKITDKLDWNNVIYDSNEFTVYGYNNRENLLKDFNN